MTVVPNDEVVAMLRKLKQRNDEIKSQNNQLVVQFEGMKLEIRNYKRKSRECIQQLQTDNEILKKKKRYDRNSRGGGVRAYIRNGISYSVIDEDIDFGLNSEQLWVKLHLKYKTVALGVEYIAPASHALYVIDQIDSIISTVLPTVDEVIILYDKNVNLFNAENPPSRCFGATD
ncbi:hypothetical protein JTB14_025970 [Gonioctena quinquepunctata]|nr:hypothetical protein JTB14_025970 [Gonioctena quinquepunctata]